MKKAILVLTLLLFVGVSAQQEVNTSTFELKDRFGRALSPDIKINPSDSKPYYNNFAISTTDSLIGADTVSHNFNGFTLFSEINLYNGGADDDTVIVEYYDQFNGIYTTSTVGLIDASTNSVISDNATIIIDNGAVKRYRLNEPFAGQVRIRTKVTTAQAADKIYIGFLGKN